MVIRIFTDEDAAPQSWSIEDFGKKVEENKLKGATHVKLNLEYDYDLAYTFFTFYYEREETEEERVIRESRPMLHIRDLIGLTDIKDLIKLIDFDQ